jgi:hypothetical protein
MMDERERQELTEVEQLMEHPGWAVLMRQTQERIDSFQKGSPFNIADEKALYFAKGVVATLLELLHTEDRCKATRDSYLAASQQALDIDE